MPQYIVCFHVSPLFLCFGLISTIMNSSSTDCHDDRVRYIEDSNEATLRGDRNNSAQRPDIMVLQNIE